MSALAGWLIGIGVADLVAGAGAQPVALRRAVMAVAAGAVAGAVATVVEWPLPAAAATAAVVAVTATGWLTARTATSPQRAAASLAVAAVLVGLAVGGAALSGRPAVAPGDGLVPDRLDPSVALVLLGVALCLVGTANVVVRLLLRLADVDSVAAANRLRGGRVIGPLERLVLFGLGLAGGWIAAGFVLAAKSLLRLSELRAGDDPPGPSRGRDERVEVLSEYVLLGSLASWSLALAGVGVVAVAV